MNHNGTPFLGRLLDSLRRQTFSEFKVIIPDNLATDDHFDALVAFAEVPAASSRVLVSNEGSDSLPILVPEHYRVRYQTWEHGGLSKRAGTQRSDHRRDTHGAGEQTSVRFMI